MTTDAELAQHPLLLLDVGGGSTEFILGHGTQKYFAHSFPLGTVRLMEKFPHADPPTRREFDTCRDWVKSFLQHEVRPLLEPILKNEPEPGPISSVTPADDQHPGAHGKRNLDRFDREKIDRTVLTFEQVRAHRKNLWRLPLAERKEIHGLPKLRADVILLGVLIYEAIMAEFGFKNLRVSTRGLRFAAVMDQAGETVLATD